MVEIKQVINEISFLRQQLYWSTDKYQRDCLHKEILDTFTEISEELLWCHCCSDHVSVILLEGFVVCKNCCNEIIRIEEETPF